MFIHVSSTFLRKLCRALCVFIVLYCGYGVECNLAYMYFYRIENDIAMHKRRAKSGVTNAC